MNGFLLDTNVLSEFERTSPEPKVVQWMRRTDDDLFFVSVLTLAEIRHGILRLQDVIRRTKLERWRDDLMLRFRERTLLVDNSVADLWAELTARLSSKPIPVIDGLLAATALHHSLTLVTRNTRDVQRTGVPVLNPWLD